MNNIVENFEALSKTDRQVFCGRLGGAGRPKFVAALTAAGWADHRVVETLTAAGWADRRIAAAKSSPAISADVAALLEEVSHQTA